MCTADIYDAGDSERMLGRWMASKRREDYVVATKARGPMGPASNDRGLSRKHLVASLEASLERLQTPYVDLYQCHFYDVTTPTGAACLCL
jgi:aryl-alcohol dehydrogenase-like predicted oxidoreductase